MHHSRKYSPTHHADVISTLSVPLLNKLPNLLVGCFDGSFEEPFKKEKPTMLNSKMKAARRTPSPRDRHIDHVEKNRREAQNDAQFRCNENGGAAARSRKKGYKPPDVRTIFEPSTKDPRVKEERGEGHLFKADAAREWCDVCCNYIFQDGLTCTAMRRSRQLELRHSWRSSGCKYTCHAQCRNRVTLDCHQNGSSSDGLLNALAQDHLNNNQSTHSDVEKEGVKRTHLSVEETRRKIELYNAATRDHLKMTLNADGLYTGFIKVQLELRRPITVRGGGGGGGGMKAQEAFYLPRGCINTLHISSSNTVRQVIEALLCKFTVADNPAKFALYKRFQREDHVCVCKLAEGEHPLLLRLLAGPSLDTLSFVLREQQTGEVMWDAFSIPELHNFLRILDKEEQDQVQGITARYNIYRKKLEEAIRASCSPD